jgi:hypothetical protein
LFAAWAAAGCNFARVQIVTLFLYAQGILGVFDKAGEKVEDIIGNPSRVTKR